MIETKILRKKYCYPELTAILQKSLSTFVDRVQESAVLYTTYTQH
jgi:hypothetical protein